MLRIEAPQSDGVILLGKTNHMANGTSLLTIKQTKHKCYKVTETLTTKSSHMFKIVSIILDANI